MSACKIRDCQHTLDLNCVFEANRKQYHRSDFFVISKQREWKMQNCVHMLYTSSNCSLHLPMRS